MVRKKLNVGCGKKILEGYDNLDILPIEDIKHSRVDTRDIPVKDEYYDEVHSTWLLEHFTKDDVAKVLLEWKRVLKEGGVVWAVANNQEATNSGLSRGEISWEDWELLTLGKDKGTLGGCHKALFREKDLQEAFKTAGFNKIETRTTTKVRGEQGELKCPGIIISAIK